MNYQNFQNLLLKAEGLEAEKCVLEFFQTISDSLEKAEFKKENPSPNGIHSIKLNPIEKTRTYTFPNSEKVIIKNIEEIKVSESGNHRLKTSDGKLHIVPTGWLHIEIEALEWTF